MTIKKVQKCLIKLDDFIDDDRLKLCYRIKGLEKSYKRMFKLLVQVAELTTKYNADDVGVDIWCKCWRKVLKDIRDELERRVL